MAKSRALSRTAKRAIPASRDDSKFESLLNEGRDRLGRGDVADAIRAFSAAALMRPKYGPVHTYLGSAYRAGGQLESAIASHRKALSIDTRLAAAYNNLGNALLDVGDLAGSEGSLREACRLDPHYVDAHCNLGLVLKRLHRLAEAKQMFARALTLSPGNVHSHRHLSDLLLREADFGGAEQHLRLVCDGAASTPTDFLMLGAALEGLARFDEADVVYERVIAFAPDLPEAWYALGRRFSQRGEPERAAEAFRRALAGNSRLAPAYLGLSSLGKHGLCPEDVPRIQELLSSPALPDPDRSSLLYALARRAEGECEFDAAFEWARKANDIDRKRTRFDEADNRRFVQASKAVFTETFSRELGGGSSSERPIFIVGMPRSGTTLVEQILSSHPDVAGGGELSTIPDMVSTCSAGTEPNAQYPLWVKGLSPREVGELAAAYLAKLAAVEPFAKHVTDKLPFNFRHLGLITTLFPRARIVHCRRDPRDVAVSCYFIQFHKPISFSCSLFELGAYLRHYEDLMSHWRQVLPRPMFEVQYEDLVQDPEPYVRGLLEFCGLSWDPNCLTPHMSERIVRTASADQVRRPIYSASAGKWKNYGKHLLPLLAELEGRIELPRTGSKE